MDKVAFTGSTEVGKKIVDAAKGNLKKVTLELGGKSPNIVFADADFDSAVEGSLNAWLFNHGQCCVAGTRLYVEDTIFEKFTEAVAHAASQVKIGPGLDPTTQLGPLVSQEQFDKVTGYLREGIADGARALTGGNRWGRSGYFVEPTVFVDVKPEFSIVQEEIFGPVVAALPFNADDGPITAANDSIYGLAAGIWTRDISKAHRTAKRLKAGSVWINQYNGFDTAMPFGGYKQSGWGPRARRFGYRSLHPDQGRQHRSLTDPIAHSLVRQSRRSPVKTKAAVLLEPGKPFEIMELDLDGPGVGEVLIKYTAAGLCHSDLHLTDGDLPPRYPIVGGHEGSGIIEEVGPGVTKVKPGDHVVCSFIPQLRHLSLLLDRSPEPLRHGCHHPRRLDARRFLPFPRQRNGFRRNVHVGNVLRARHHFSALGSQDRRLASLGDSGGRRLRRAFGLGGNGSKCR